MTAHHFAHMTARMKALQILGSHTPHASMRARVCKLKACMHAYVHTCTCVCMRAPRAVRTVCGLRACGAVCGHVYARAVLFFYYLKLKK